MQNIQNAKPVSKIRQQPSHEHFNKNTAKRQGASQEEYNREWQAPIFGGNNSGNDADTAGRFVLGRAVTAENSAGKCQRTGDEEPEREHDEHCAKGNSGQAPAAAIITHT